jgi:predicted dehydrogenase
MRIGLVGYGYWGRNLLRNIIETGAASCVTVCDSDPERLAEARSLYAAVKTMDSFEEVISSSCCDAIVIATPTSSHYDLARRCLLAGIHTLVEKPLTTDPGQAVELASLAAERGLVLMADHTFVYNPVVRRMRQEMESGVMGRISYIDATRVNLGIYQSDSNVLWDLACHDLSIIFHLLKERPDRVRTIGRHNAKWGVTDLAYMFLHYPSGLLAQLNFSWASPVKMRRMVIGAEHSMAVFDDIEPMNKLVIHQYPDDVPGMRQQALTDYRLGNIIAPKYENTEPLRCMMDDFIHCVQTGATPLADAGSAIEVIRVLAKAEESLRQDGTPIPITWTGR